jgi:ATP-dependent DNA helicase RecG
MRPKILYPLFAPVTSIKGVGPRIAKSVEKLTGVHVLDLAWHLPSGLIDRRYAPHIADAAPGAIATITVQVGTHHKPHSKRMPYKIVCRDDTGFLTLVFFHAHEDYLRRALPEGETRVVSGKVELFNDERQMTHPDHIGTLAEIEKLQAIEPVYRLTQGVSLKVLSKAIGQALATVPELAEWLDPALIKREGWQPWHESLLAAHAPASEADLEPLAPARRRLAYDELLANQLALAVVRHSARRAPGREIKGDGRLRDKLLEALPYRLTKSQEAAVADIIADMGSKVRMHRLLQGDVGSGKTVVAVMAMLNAVESGAQAVLLAPTEVLARQHFATIEPLATQVGVHIALLTGREKGKNREAILAGLADGDIDIVVGTHALLQDPVEFKNLDMTVIDEQHRFGVHQRLALAAKGRAPDMLVMTATPIPRTLTLTAYGDMEVSRLTEKPPGRENIVTTTASLARLGEVIAGVGRQLDKGAKVYWVCPLVEDSEKSDLAAAEERHAALKRVFGERVGLIHGRMKGVEKDAAMAGFAAGEIRLLVATTVIEVGVDVPDATVMVVEHAERFGLAQLHQLRGRVGRAPGDPSTCLLLFAPNLTLTARQRLDILRNTDDGFRIAEEDLKLRGAGELLGTRQSGLPEFRLADLAVHGELLAVARDDARLIVDKDPGLESARGKNLRVLLYLFERDAAVRLLRSG